MSWTNFNWLLLQAAVTAQPSLQDSSSTCSKSQVKIQSSTWFSRNHLLKKPFLGKSTINIELIDWKCFRAHQLQSHLPAQDQPWRYLIKCGNLFSSSHFVEISLDLNCFRAHQPQSHLPAQDQPWRSDFASLSPNLFCCTASFTQFQN